MDVVLPADRIDEFLRLAAVSGFVVLPQVAGRWPKVRHKDTDIKVDVLPEGGRPGSAAKPAPTVIPHPSEMGAITGALRYIGLPSLVLLKIAAGRARDEADVVELIRTNENQVDAIRTYLAQVHAHYVAAFDVLLDRARQQHDE
jgi:hypothetical protein